MNPVLLATTSSTDSPKPKDYYNSHTFEDTTIQEGHEYTYKLFSYNEFDNPNSDSRNVFERSNSFNWPILHQLSHDGVLSSYFEIGDLFTVNHEEFGELKLRLVDFDGAEPVDRIANPHAAVFECVDLLCFKNTMKFDLAYIQIVDPAYAATPDRTFIDGKTYYTKSENTYTSATVTAGDTVPANTYYEKFPTWTQYKEHPEFYDSTTDKDIVSWHYSQLKLWLNSDATTWYQRQNRWSTTDAANYNGFLYGLDKELKDCLVEVERRTWSQPFQKFLTSNCKVFIPYFVELKSLSFLNQNSFQYQRARERHNLVDVQWDYYKNTQNTDPKRIKGIFYNNSLILKKYVLASAGEDKYFDTVTTTGFTQLDGSLSDTRTKNAGGKHFAPCFAI